MTRFFTIEPDKFHTFRSRAIAIETDDGCVFYLSFTLDLNAWITNCFIMNDDFDAVYKRTDCELFKVTVF